MRQLYVVGLVAVLAGCGGGETGQAVKACADAVAEKLGADRSYRLDQDSMAAQAQRQDDVVHIRSPIVFDPGLTGEYTQTLDCKARFGENGGTPDVISLNFIW